MVTPDYYDKFKCIGSACKNNCCCGAWEIEVDDEALSRFNRIEGEFGKRVLDSINDENVFIHKNGRCPMLMDNGLCEMVCRGEDLCVICDEYPRFTQYFDDYAERGISLSCEAAAKIILDNQSKVCLVGDSGECDEPIFRMLYNARTKIFGILQNRDEDILKRIRLVLDYGRALQDKINENDFSDFTYIPRDTKSGDRDLTEIFRFMQTLDILDDKWRDMLKKAAEAENSENSHMYDTVLVEQLAIYFVYRYFLTGVFDCDPFSKLKFMAVSVMAIIAMGDICGGIYESARLYSIEIEHNEDNVDAFYDEFLFNDSFSIDNMINLIK